jgi:hypothetical protein
LSGRRHKVQSTVTGENAEQDQVVIFQLDARDAAPSPIWRVTMPSKSIDSYVVEFTGELLEGSDQWGAYVSISAPSDNPMHMKNIYPKRRVSAELALSDQQVAEAEAERAAAAILSELRS